MDVKLSNIYYDRVNKQTLVSIGSSQLTIPDYMTIADIEYFLAEKSMNLLRDSVSMMQAQGEIDKSPPLQKALQHYKDLGWEFLMTTKQKIAIDNMVKGDSARKAMLKAGYAPSVAKNPKLLTETKAFIETLENLGLSDEKLAKVLDEGLSASKVIVMGTKSDESFVDVVPDHPTRHKFLETALRLKGHTQEEATNNITIQPILVKFIDAKHD